MTELEVEQWKHAKPTQWLYNEIKENLELNLEYMSSINPSNDENWALTMARLQGSIQAYKLLLEIEPVCQSSL